MNHARRTSACADCTAPPDITEALGGPFYCNKVVEGAGFEPAKAEPSDLQSDPFGRSGTPPKKRSASAKPKLELARGVEPPTG